MIVDTLKTNSLVEKLKSLDLKNLLGLKGNEVFGLDIGTASVKLIKLCKNDDGYVVTAAGIADIQNSGVNANREANVTEAIKKCVTSSGIKTSLAVCSVCGPEVAVRCFELPCLPPEEIKGAVLLEASEVCPFSIDEQSVDYQLIPGDDNKIRGVLVATTNKLIEGKKRLTKNASLNSALMDVDGLAILNCLGEYEKTETGQTTAILNIGSSYTNLVITGDNTLPFVRDIAFGGQAIIQEVADDNDIPVETVVKWLDDNCKKSSKLQSGLTNSFHERCQRLIDNVNETLRYYAGPDESVIVEKIYVCGGFAMTKGIVELLNSQLEAEVVLWNPFDRIRHKAGMIGENILMKNGPAMVVATGLATRLI